MSEVIDTFLGILVLVTATILFSKISLKKQIAVTKPKLILVIIIASLIYTIIYMYLEGIMKTLLIFVGYFVIFKYIYNLNINKAIFLSFIYIIILMFIDLIIFGLCMYVFKMSKEYCYNVFAGSMLGNFVVCVLLLIITYLFKNKLNNLLVEGIKTDKKIILFSTLTLICIAMFFHTIIYVYEVNGNVLGLTFAIFVFLFILIDLFKEKKENLLLSLKYDDLWNFMKAYEVEIENQRILRHETKNQLITIKSKIIDKEVEVKILEYIDNILGEKIDFIQEKYAKYQYLPANGLKALFYFKTMEAEKYNINVDINISKDIESSYLKDLSASNFKQLGRIIGVYLDNAIEASSVSSKKLLGIEMYMINNKIELIISNSYTGNIDVSKIGRKIFSTKGKNRGRGLLLVNNIIKANHLFEATRTITSQLYIQKLIIKNKPGG